MNGNQIWCSNTSW